MNKIGPRLSPSCLGELSNICRAAEFRLAFVVGVSLGSEFCEYWLGDLGEFPAASTIKSAILVELYRRFAAGDLDPEEQLTVTEKDIVEGGIMPELAAGRSFSLRELARLMIVVSDNTASNLLLDKLGMDALNAHLKSFGMTQSVVRRHFMEDAAKRGDNITTALDLLALLRSLDSGELVADPWRQEILDILHRQMFIDKIPAELPAGTWFANKVGELEGVRHDMAIIVKEHMRIYLVALTQNVPGDCVGDRTISKLARLVYDGVISNEDTVRS